MIFSEFYYKQMMGRNLNRDKLMVVLHKELEKESKYRPIILYCSASPQVQYN